MIVVIIVEEKTNVVYAEGFFKLTPASDLKVLTQANEIVFKENALKSKAYNRLLGLITEGSLEGRYEVELELFQDEDAHVLPVFKKVLEEAGYSVIHHSNKPSLIVKW